MLNELFANIDTSLLEQEPSVTKQELIQACKHLPEGELLDKIIKMYVDAVIMEEALDNIKRMQEDNYMQEAVASLNDKHSHYETCLEQTVMSLQGFTGLYLSYTEADTMLDVLEHTESEVDINDLAAFLQEEYDLMLSDIGQICGNTTVQELVGIIHKAYKPEH